LLKVEQFHPLARDCVMFAPNDRDFIVAFDRDSQLRLVTTDQKIGTAGSAIRWALMGNTQALCGLRRRLVPL